MSIPWGWISVGCFTADYVLRQQEKERQARELAEARALDDRRAELQVQYDTMKIALDRQNEKIRHMLEVKERVWQQEKANMGCVDSSPPVVIEPASPPPAMEPYVSSYEVVKQRQEEQNRLKRVLQIVAYCVVLGFFLYMFAS
jgi:hypothetical protein